MGSKPRPGYPSAGRGGLEHSPSPGGYLLRVSGVQTVQGRAPKYSQSLPGLPVHDFSGGAAISRRHAGRSGADGIGGGPLVPNASRGLSGRRSPAVVMWYSRIALIPSPECTVCPYTLKVNFPIPSAPARSGKPQPSSRLAPQKILYNTYSHFSAESPDYSLAGFASQTKDLRHLKALSLKTVGSFQGSFSRMVQSEPADIARHRKRHGMPLRCQRMPHTIEILDYKISHAR